MIGWPDLLNKILAATTSGQGPDVLNIGNTWAASLQATGAFMPFDAAALDAVGGKDKFVEAAFKTGGAEGKDPTSVPLYGLVYGLYYNKKMFADAGRKPADDVGRADRRGKKLTNPGKGVYGMARGRQLHRERPLRLHLRQAERRAARSTPAASRRSPRDGMVNGVKQYVDLMARQGGQPQQRAVQERPQSRRATSPRARPRC